MNKNVSPNTARYVKRVGLTGIAAGILACLVCELPIVLALLGVTSLGIGSAWLNSNHIEAIGVASVLGGGLTLFAMLAMKRRRRG